MMRDSILLIHIASGTAGLLLGPAWLFTNGRVKMITGIAYQAAMPFIVTSGIGLAILNFANLWWLIPIGAATQAAALLGPPLRKWKAPHGDTWYVHVLGGSYIALVTALLVASTGNPIWWIVPAIAAQPLLALAKRRLKRDAQLPQDSVTPWKWHSRKSRILS